MLININIKPYKNKVFVASELLNNKKSNHFLKKGMILVLIKINDTYFYILHQKI
jgi:hypothetical protein